MDGRGTFHSVLRRRDFRRVLVGLAVSEAGDWLYNVALLVFILNRTHSGSWVAAATVARLSPYVIVGPLGGLLAERHDYRRVMIGSDLIRAALMGALALLAAVHGPPVGALALVFFSTSAGCAYVPAVTAMTPSIVSESEFAAANALIQTVANIAIVVGPAFGALLLLLGSPWAAFLTNAGSFLMAAAAVASVPPRKARRFVAPADTQNVVERVVEGARALTGTGGLGAAATIYTASGLIYGAETVLLLLVAQSRLGLSENGVGWLYAGLGAGGVVAARAASWLADRRNITFVIAIAIIGTGIPLAALGLVQEPYSAVAIVAVGGACSVVVDVLVTTLVQRTLPPHIVARAFGLLDSAALGSMLIGSVIAVPLASGLGTRNALIVAGGAVPLATILLLPRLRRAQGKWEARKEELRPAVELFSGLGVFDGASRQSLEWLAAHVDEQHVVPGEFVVREGDPADSFYVVRSGSLGVLAYGESKEPSLIRVIGEGDYFGEIGLLECIPRTATVRAFSDANLLHVKGEDFLAAINDQTSLSGTLINTVSRRLSQTHPSYRPQTTEVVDAEGAPA
ncbi:MAG: MFS transporter [Actinobacteria bacterium]|nr:MAG: MFS transporter [Actinomycetota bacterium]